MVDLFRHQTEAVAAMTERDRYGFFDDCGTGKTIGVLAGCAARPMRTVVACPKAIIDGAWLKDAAHFPQLRVISGRGDRYQRTKILRGEWDILVINYELLKKHIDDLAGIPRLVFDESSALKNYDSQTTKACLRLAYHAQCVYLLSGTPWPNDESESWAPMFALRATTDSYWRYCNRYFSPIKKTISGRTFTAGWKLLDSRRAEFEAMIRGVSRRLLKSDAVDLPPQTDLYRIVTLSADEQAAYDRMHEELVAEWNGTAFTVAMAAKLIKLRQLAGGGVLIDGRRLDYGCAKLEELAAACQEIGTSQAVIWAEFTADIDRIARLLGNNCAVIDGRTPDGVRASAINRFQAGGLRYLVCHPRAVGHGITLTAASYAIYYSMGFSYETYEQSRNRIHRIGQRWPCTYIHLLADGTCDWQVLKVLQRKGSAAEAMAAALRLTKTESPRNLVASPGTSDTPF